MTSGLDQARCNPHSPGVLPFVCPAGVWVVSLLLALLAGCADPGGTPSSDPVLVSPGVAYHPRGFSPLLDNPPLSSQPIIEDLRLLRKSGFLSLVTYTANGVMGSIPEIARGEGFGGTIIMGIWDPSSVEELRNAVAQSPYVDGYCLGNEGLGVRYGHQELAAKMAELRRLTDRPVTTSEPIDSYLQGPHREWLLSHSDWLFPLAHPFWASKVDPDVAVDWVLARYDFLVATTRRQVILKETGVPTAGMMGFDEESQIAFFAAIESAGPPFFYFEAFDQPWKRDVLRHHEAEAHWGLYHNDGRAKRVVAWLAGRFAQP
ncbi:MAG: hypothetical protein GY731_07985 [Gammaproteobacteria bacterium]|nr:hypothetical protein [Gammaproteobacteria bacterium]